MEEVTQRFSHLSEAIFKFLNTETLIRCQSVSKIWQNYLVDIMNERRVVVLQRNIQNFREIQDFNANFDLESEQKTIQLAKMGNFSFAIENIMKVFNKVYENYIQLGWTVPYSAASCGHFKVVNFIIDNLQDNNPQNSDSGATALHYAVAHGNELYIDLAMYILKNVQEKNPGDNNGMTPLHLASLRNHIAFAKFLIDNIDEKNPGDLTGRTPLHHCAMLGHFEILKHIMKNVKDKNPGDRMCWTPLHEAIKKNWNFHIIEHIVNNVKDKNPGDINGRTPLHEAVKYGYLNVVKFLMSNAGDKNPADKKGQTPLHEAIIKGNYDIVRYIIENVEEKAIDVNSFLDVVKYIVQKETLPYDQGKEGNILTLKQCFDYLLNVFS